MSNQPAGRLEPLEPGKMTPEQKEVYDDIMSGPRGSVQGPFNAWLRSPALVDPAQKLGEFCRFNNSLGSRLSEIAILITARKFRCQVEWFLHARIAMAAGHSQSTIDALMAGDRPDFASAPGSDTEKENMVYDYAIALVRDGRVDDETHSRALDVFGEQGLVELVGVIGYYHLVSLTLNAFNVPLPEPGELPFPEE
jgi:4-carboxymuconolactone decarboxylase